MTDNDLFDAFGSDDSESESDTVNDALQRKCHEKAAILAVCSRVLRSISLHGGCVVFLDSVTDIVHNQCRDQWVQLLNNYKFEISHHLNDPVDLIISTKEEAFQSESSVPCHPQLVPGGCLVSKKDIASSHPMEFRLVQKLSDTFISQRWPCRIQYEHTCPWLPKSHRLESELARAAQATICVGAKRTKSRHYQDPSYPIDHIVNDAVSAINQFGFCIIPGLLNPSVSLEYSDAIRQDLHSAALIMKDKMGIDIYAPDRSKQEPGAYRELSMREDLRLDIRHGPSMEQVRGPLGNRPLRLKKESAVEGDILRGHALLLAILRGVMNPQYGDLGCGNFGRYNFGGSGPDQSPQELRLGVVGGIVSLPGAAEQALHADTPHLFEHLDRLPPHYINIFTPGCPSNSKVGQTAFIQGSHHLHYTRDWCVDHGERNAFLWNDLVRPQLELGDVILFDCRILHFGLANSSEDIERPVLYTNCTLHWFQDPKNWEDNHCIFNPK